MTAVLHFTHAYKLGIHTGYGKLHYQRRFYEFANIAGSRQRICVTENYIALVVL